ncbi:MAG TPA: amidohydrolase family protein [Acidobacteriaceae bacterium]|jgi:imidazolonepropionase-like amidohydrolase
MRTFCLLVVLSVPAITQTPAQQPERVIEDSAPVTLAPAVAKFVKYDTAKNTLWLEHVRVIDGTGAAPLEDATVILSDGKIAAILTANQMQINQGHMSTWSCADCPPALHIDLTGRTVFPGLVGMHDHMYYIARPNFQADGKWDPPLIVPEMLFSSPRLYLGAGVTTLRTTGSVEPYVDLNLRREIDAGQLPGPHLDVTAPYLEGPNSRFIQMHNLKDAADAKATVDFWAAQGATSFKAYMNITRAELKAAIDEAHKLGFKLTGHLCAVTYPEAVALGIDNLEHGFFVNTQLDPGKQPDLCPRTAGGPTMAKMTPDTPEGKALIALLVQHHVAVTSTLPVFQSDDPEHLRVDPRLAVAMSPPAREAYDDIRKFELARAAADPKATALRAQEFKNDMAMEHAFVEAGGLLLAGPDPTGDGGTLPGYGDQRELELLVTAGFTPLEAIRIGTLNGATYEGRADHIGSIAEGKNADLVVVKGNPATNINDIENTELVFKDGVAFDSQALLGSVKGRYGQY